MRTAPRETLPSYLSRLAASKGVTTGDLAYDLGVSMKRFLQADEAAVDALARWAKLSAAEVEEMLSWTGVPIGNVRLQFRGEPVVSRALRNPAVQGCPVCLREDAATNPAEPLSAMVMRGHWQMREVCVCLRHRRLLVTLWTEQELL
ncbi:TniQ family protein [Haematobacter genomosp. 1]|uniref:TniQ family protein n=1 Tax=Haematobacter genomosp. 1 TaxID=366618 RepID=UPI00211AD639|nr:TniQ family protein [Haematobacter genomosp. 1]